MGRRRERNHDLPPLMHRRGGRFYYGRNDIALGADFAKALRKYAELHGEKAQAGSFADAADHYVKHALPARAPATQKSYRSYLEPLLAVFGRMPLDAVRPVHIRQYLRNRRGKDGKYDAKVVATREKALFSIIFNHAREEGLTDAPNPAAGIKGTKAKSNRYVTHEEFQAIYLHPECSEALQNFLELAYLTGQRPADVLKMTNADVVDGCIRVVQNKTKAKRQIRLVGRLLAFVQRLPAGERVWLIRNDAGQPMTVAAMRKRLDVLKEKTGQTWTLQAIRAKSATDLKDKGKAQALLGHTSAAMTETYLRAQHGPVVEPLQDELPFQLPGDPTPAPIPTNEDK